MRCPGEWQSSVLLARLVMCCRVSEEGKVFCFPGGNRILVALGSARLPLLEEVVEVLCLTEEQEALCFLGEHEVFGSPRGGRFWALTLPTQRRRALHPARLCKQQKAVPGLGLALSWGALRRAWRVPLAAAAAEVPLAAIAPGQPTSLGTKHETDHEAPGACPARSGFLPADALWPGILRGVGC